MSWEFRDDIPIYTQLITQIQQRIVTGQLPPGARLPSVRDLASDAGVNPNTMQKALADLERQGLVHSHRTAGRFVTEEDDTIQTLKQSLAKTQAQEFLSAMSQLGFGLDEIVTLIQTEGENTCLF